MYTENNGNNIRANRDLHRVIFRLNEQALFCQAFKDSISDMVSFHSLDSQ